MKKRTGDDWFPFWIDKWLLGSTRDELTIEQCAVWVDFLALSYKDEGYIRANEGIPYPIKRLSGLLNRPIKLIQQTIDRCLEPKINKLRLESDGTLYVISHPEYELSKRHKRRLMEDDVRQKGHDDRQKDTKRRREKSRIDKNREDKEILNLLSKVKNYPLNKEKDLEFIKELKVEFPDVAILEKVKQICANWLDRPLLKKSRPRVQIRRWVSNEQKWQQEGDKERKVGRLYAKEPQFLSMELLNNVYRIINGKGGDKGKFYIKAKLAFPKIKTKWQQSDKKPETFIRLVESVQ